MPERKRKYNSDLSARSQKEKVVQAARDQMHARELRERIDAFLEYPLELRIRIMKMLAPAEIPVFFHGVVREIEQISARLEEKYDALLVLRLEGLRNLHDFLVPYMPAEGASDEADDDDETGEFVVDGDPTTR